MNFKNIIYSRAQITVISVNSNFQQRTILNAQFFTVDHVSKRAKGALNVIKDPPTNFQKFSKNF